ncbi:tetratricopeptide repeat protein [Sphingomonas sp.]|jgi:hypothetical protein|uniref:tetratricopeptide repeat protein n=1 Tax=Sphingomonas sp. TaxID=28214 RepID=UPI002ED84612
MKLFIFPFALLALAAAPMQDAAELGVGKALLRAGNVTAALSKLEAAAAKGSGEAAKLIGDLYDEGNGVAADKAQAAAWYRKGAEGGNTDAMFALGVALDAGTGVTKDQAEALRWFERAGNAGHVRAMYWAGDAYMDGLGVTADPAKAIPWLRKSAEAGYRLAMVDYGYALDKGNGVPQDQAAAFAWYRKGGELGSGTGAFNTGVFYRDGIGVAADQSAAFYWFLRAATAASPHSDAEKELAALREAGVSHHNPAGEALAAQGEALRHRAKTDKELVATRPQVFALNLQAAQLGHLPSINYMMTAFREKGWGTEPDLEKSRQWAQISAEMDDKEGQRVLAAMMLNGMGGPRNAQGARFWFEKAALQGNPQAMMSLAQIYDGDKGLPPNEALAIYWYKQAWAKKWYGADTVLLARGVLKPDPVATSFIERMDRQGPDRSSVSAFTFDVAQYCKYGGSRCTALSIEARNFEKAQNSAAESANMARIWNNVSTTTSDAQWRARSECMTKKTESIQRHTYGQQDWYYSGACY